MKEIKQEHVSLIFRDGVVVGMLRRDGEHVKNYVVKVATLQDMNILISDDKTKEIE